MNKLIALALIFAPLVANAADKTQPLSRKAATAAVEKRLGPGLFGGGWNVSFSKGETATTDNWA